MKIFSWNVNGIRAAARKNFLDFLETWKPDILLLQETKINEESRNKVVFGFEESYEGYWNYSHRAGYSGTAILIKKSFLGSTAGNSSGEKKATIPEFDREGRLQCLESDGFYLLNAYFPNSNHELSRLPFKLEFNQRTLDLMNKLKKKKPVIIGGDFNVAPEELDLANPKPNRGNAGFTDEERQWIDRLNKSGYTDLYRKFHGSRVQYTWWSQRFNARPRNIGWRIDHFFASGDAVKLIKSCEILDKITGSDHCPIMIEI